MPLWAAIIVTLAWLLLVLFWRANRIWLPYYITSTVGMAFVLIFFGGRATPLSQWMETASVWAVHSLSSLIRIPTQVFSQEPGSLMILVIDQNIGWTMLQVSIESSGVLESCVLVSMVMFYPGWSVLQKARLILIGLVATFGANIVRLMLITSMLHYVGKDSLLISHAVAGRLVFFVLVIVIFWTVITLPTLRSVRHKLEQEART